ncbi:site-2 protease family protein [Aliishimia ponticola]|nr:site-2 protease family protein [Aliishimia ponticola]
MFGNEAPIFRFNGPLGVPVEFGTSIIFLALIFIGVGVASPDAFVHGLILFGMVVLSIFLHEFGHAWGAWVQGVPVQKVVIYGGGGYCQHAATGPRESELIVAMGPLVNLALWALSSLGAWWILQGFDFSEQLSPADFATAQFKLEIYSKLAMFAHINLFLFILNLIPVQPLDGGRLLHLGLLRFVPQMAALRIAGVIGLFFALAWVPAMLVMYLQFGWLLLFMPPIWMHWEMAKGNAPV